MTSLRLELQGLVGSELLARAILILSIGLIGLVLSWILAKLIVVAVTRWLTPFDDDHDRRFDAQFRLLKAPLRALLFGTLLNLSTRAVLIEADAWLAQAGLIFGIAAGGWLAVRALTLLEDTATARLAMGQGDNLEARSRFTQLRGFRNIATFLLLVVTIAFILLSFERVRELGAGLLASAGVAGVVLGFAAQRSIATIVAGVQIALSQPIRVEDVVIVEGEWGHIEEITLTYVVVRIWDLRRLVVPVNYFIEKPFQNWTRTSAELLGTVDLYLDYSVPVDAIREETKKILENSETWDRKVFNVQVVRSDERSMVVRPLFSAKNSGDHWNLRCEVREKLIAFVQQNFPDSLPRIRAELPAGGPTRA